MRPVLLAITAHDANALHETVEKIRDLLVVRTRARSARPRLHSRASPQSACASPVRRRAHDRRSAPGPRRLSRGRSESRSPHRPGQCRRREGPGDGLPGPGITVARHGANAARARARLRRGDRPHRRRLSGARRVVAAGGARGTRRLRRRGRSGLDDSPRRRCSRCSWRSRSRWPRSGGASACIRNAYSVRAWARSPPHTSPKRSRSKTWRGSPVSVVSVVARAAGRGTMAVVSLGRDAVDSAARRLAGGCRDRRRELAVDDDPVRGYRGGPRRRRRLRSGGRLRAPPRGRFRLATVSTWIPCSSPSGARSDRSRRGPPRSRSTRRSMASTKRGEELDADYWLRNLREPVAFDRGLAASLEGGGEIFLEVSPHPALPRAIDETAQALGHAPRYVSSLRRAEDEQKKSAAVAGRARRARPSGRLRGAVARGSGRRPSALRLSAKALFLQRAKPRRHASARSIRCSACERTPPSTRDCTAGISPSTSTAGASSSRPAMRPAARDRRVSARPPPCTSSSPWPPATRSGPGAACRVTGLEPRRALELGTEGRRAVQVVVREDGRAGCELRIASRAGTADAFASARDRPDRGAADRGDGAGRGRGRRSAPARGQRGLSIDDYYAALERCGVTPGSKGRVLRELECEAGSADRNGSSSGS